MRQLRRDKRPREAGYQFVHLDRNEINGDPGYVVSAVRLLSTMAVDVARRQGRRGREPDTETTLVTVSSSNCPRLSPQTGQSPDAGS